MSGTNNPITYDLTTKEGIDAYIKNEGDQIENDKTDRLDDAKSDYNAAVNSLGRVYDNRIKALDSDKSSSEQIAAINYAKLLKYLPEQLKSVGLGSLGTSSSAYLRANNNYMNRLSDAKRVHHLGSMEADNEFSIGKSKALSEYSAIKNAINSSYDTKMANLGVLYGNLLNTYEDNTYRNDEIKYNEAIYALDSMDFADVNALEEFAKEYSFNNTGFASAFASAVALKKNEMNAKLTAIDEENAKLGTNTLSASIYRNKDKKADLIDDTVKLKLENGDTVKLNLGSEASDVAEVDGVKNIGNGTLFVYDGEYYYKDETGRVITVNSGKQSNKLYNYLVNGDELKQAAEALLERLGIDYPENKYPSPYYQK